MHIFVEHWEHNATLMFIALCEDNKENFSNTKLKKKEIYAEISERLKAHGYAYSTMQCENRMKTLTSKYKEVNDHNNTSGNDHKSWQYLEIMTDYFGDSPNVTPIASCSSMNPERKTKNSGQKEPTPKRNLTSSDESELDSPRSEKRRRLRNTPRSDLLKWLKEYVSNMNKREDARLELLNRHHNENKELIERF